MSVKGTQKGMMIGLKNATEKNASPYALYGIDGDTFIEASDDGLAVGVLNPMYEWEERLHPGEGKPELGICPEDVYGGIQINGIVDVTAEAGITKNDLVKVGSENVGDSDGKMVASAGTFADLAAGDNPVFIFGIAMEASHATVDGSVISVLVMKFVVPASAAVTT
jgi:hypothetical protein